MFEKVILFLLAILFLIILPIISTYKYWNYKPFMKYALSLIWISYIVIIYEVINPRNTHYLNLLNKASNLTFGDNIKVFRKYTSFMNYKAQYHSCAVFEITNNVTDLNILKEEEKVVLPKFSQRCENMISQEFDTSKLISYKTVDEKSVTYWGYEKSNNKIFLVYNFHAMAYKD